MPRPPKTPEGRHLKRRQFEALAATIYRMLRNMASGPEIGFPGRISAGFDSGKPQNRSSGRPSAGRRDDVEAFPMRIRPKSSPEARFPTRMQYCVK